MKRKSCILVTIVLLLLTTVVKAQTKSVQTIFRSDLESSGGFGALTNKFTSIRGEYANLTGIYGGWYVNHSFMIGAGASALTNNIYVPLQHSTDPLRNLSYEYGQVGLVTEYVVNSNKPVHIAFNLFSGAGFTLQYDRYGWYDTNPNWQNVERDENWFFVLEPGVQLELNLLKWMRLCPGVSYRATFGSDGRGVTDKDLSNISYNATLKFGKF
jgi:hypothetical protein